MSESQLRPEPWAFHLLGLISPLLAISGNILGVIEDQVFVAMGVVFFLYTKWVTRPLDIA